jgi:hypothetical protein
MKPGDKQPIHRNEALHPFREAARVRRQFVRDMQSVKRTVNVTPEQLDSLEQQLLNLDVDAR